MIIFTSLSEFRKSWDNENETLPRQKAAQTVGILFVLGALLSFAVIGKWWGMLWIFLTFPLSFLVESTIGIGSNSLFLIVAITFASGFLWAMLVYGGCRLIAGFDQD